VGALESYFYEQVDPSSLDGDVKAYLVMSMARWATQAPDIDEPLGLRYMSACKEGGWALREVGDAALYLSGFAPGHTHVKISWVCDLGRSSYGYFAEQTRARVFSLLSQSFEEARSVVYEATRQAEDTLTILKRYRKKGDERDARLLEERGVHVLYR
jgi:hypothetical protein